MLSRNRRNWLRRDSKRVLAITHGQLGGVQQMWSHLLSRSLGKAYSQLSREKVTVRLLGHQFPETELARFTNVLLNQQEPHSISVKRVPLTSGDWTSRSVGTKSLRRLIWKTYLTSKIWNTTRVYFRTLFSGILIISFCNMKTWKFICNKKFIQISASNGNVLEVHL